MKVEIASMSEEFLDRFEVSELPEDIQKQFPTILETVLESCFNREIVRALLQEYVQEDLEVTDELVNEVWGMCNGNPWDAVLMYTMMNIASEFDEQKNV